MEILFSANPLLTLQSTYLIEHKFANPLCNRFVRVPGLDLILSTKQTVTSHDCVPPRQCSILAPMPDQMDLHILSKRLRQRCFFFLPALQSTV